MVRRAILRLAIGVVLLAVGGAGSLLPHHLSPCGVVTVLRVAFYLAGTLLVGWGLWGLRPRIGWRKVNLVVAAVSGVGFAAVAGWTQFLPTLRGSAWTVRDTLVRAGAVATGVVFLLATVVALVPWALDRFERGPFASYIAARHVRAKKSGFLTLISGLSIFAVALGSFSLSAAISVMGGFSADLKRKILGNNATIVGETTSQSPWGDYTPMLERLRATKGVVAATPVDQGEVMASSALNLAGVIVHGIDPTTIGSVIELRKNVEAPVKLENKLGYLENPELLRHIAPDEVIGIGPGGEEYTK